MSALLDRTSLSVLHIVASAGDQGATLSSIAAQFNTTDTTVRRKLRALEQEGFVTGLPGAGNRGGHTVKYYANYHAIKEGFNQVLHFATGHGGDLDDIG